MKIFLNWNNWYQLKLLNVTTTQTWNIPTLPPPQVNTTPEGIEKTTPYPQHDLHLAINSLFAIDNPSTTMNSSISATTVSPSYLLKYTPLLTDYDYELIPDKPHQLVVKW